MSKFDNTKYKKRKIYEDINENKKEIDNLIKLKVDLKSYNFNKKAIKIPLADLDEKRMTPAEYWLITKFEIDLNNFSEEFIRASHLIAIERYPEENLEDLSNNTGIKILSWNFQKIENNHYKLNGYLEFHSIPHDIYITVYLYIDLDKTSQYYEL